MKMFFVYFATLALSLLPMELRAEANALAASGVYGELLLGVDPQTQAMTGYYLNGTGMNSQNNGPQFSCIFYLTGKKAGESWAIQTWFPADAKKSIISGEIRFLPGAAGKPPAIALKLKEAPPGCAMAAPDLAQAEGENLPLDTPGQWTEVRVVAAKQAHFYDSPSAPAPRKGYVVQGDALRVWAKQAAWVQVDYEGKNKGWVKEGDLYPNHP